MELEYSKIAAKGFPKPLALLYLLQGSDDALKREAITRLTEGVLDPGFADFDKEERDIPTSGGTGGYDGEMAGLILASAAGAPMLSERRVVIVTNVHRLKKDDQDALAAGLSKLCERSLLILVAGAPEYDAGKVKARSAVGTKLVNAIGKAGVIVQCDAPAAGDLKARVIAMAKERGKKIEPGAVDKIVAMAVSAASDRGGGGKAGDVNVLTSELEKLVAYVGDRTQITTEDAAAVGTVSGEENIFALLDAVGKRDARVAIKEVTEMLRTGGKPDAVAARTYVMLARHLRMVWAAKFLADNRLGAFNIKGALPPEIQSVLSGEMVGLTMRQSFLLKGLQEQARGWTYPALRQGLARVLASDMAMKGGGAIKALNLPAAPGEDPGDNLRLLVVDLCQLGTGNGKGKIAQKDS